jgi:hypothetical protein
VPETNSNTAPGTDNFRSRDNTGTGTNSNAPATSIPPNANTPAGGTGTIPPFPGTNDYNSGRGTNDGGNAIEYIPPRSTPNPIDLEPDFEKSREINIEIEPLDLDSPVAVAYEARRERVRLWSTHQVPQVVAKALPDVNAGWEPVAGTASVASR